MFGLSIAFFYDFPELVDEALSGVRVESLHVSLELDAVVEVAVLLHLAEPLDPIPAADAEQFALPLGLLLAAK